MSVRLQGKWMIAAGAIWIAAAVALPLFVLEQQGSASNANGFPLDFRFSWTDASIGILHALALATASGFCLLIGIGLCAFGSVPKTEAPSNELER